MTARSAVAGAAAVFALPLVLVLVLWPLLVPIPAVGDDFQFWAAGHMVVTGQSPYDRASWEAIADYGPYPGGNINTSRINLAITNAVWLYPPQTAFLFAPFGALPYEIGVPLLHVFVLLTGLLAIAAAAYLAGLRGIRLGVALCVAIVSQPFLVSVRDGHPIGLLALGAVLLYAGIVSRRDGPAFMGTALLTLKPHLTGLFALGAFAALVSRRDWRRLGAMVAGAALVTLPFEIATPFPIASFIASTNERVAVDVSTIPALARDLGGGLPLALALAALTGAACLVALRLARAEFRARVALASALIGSLAFVPYAHDYDTLFVLPVGFVLVALGVGRPAEAVVGLMTTVAVFIVPWILFWWYLAGEPHRVFRSGPLGAVPIVLALALAGAVYASALREARRSAPDGEQRGLA
ncbi:MAG TPA: glycosyltransferase family 87 protein [Methylomirabilota bacterium]|nr:glycosyltransferase family 87 protein [Methylomirabilota bacterium]